MDIKEMWPILTNVRPGMLVDFPRINPETDKPYCELMVALISAELDVLIKAEAEKKARRMLKDHMPSKKTVGLEITEERSHGYDYLYNYFVMEGTIYHSCRMPNNYEQKFFPDQESVFKVLTSDEAAILWNHYAVVVAEYSPQKYLNEHANTDEEKEAGFNKYLDDIEASGKEPAFFLNLLSPDSVKALATFTVSQLLNLRKDKSQLGMQPEDTTSK